MKKENGTPNKRNQYILMAIIPVIVIAFMLYTNKIGASQKNNVLITDVSKLGEGQEIDAIGSEALAFYIENTDKEVNPEDVEVVKKNFGCHFEYYIYNNGVLDMKLSYSGGQFYEI